MRYKFITAGILLALSASAAAAGSRAERIIERLDVDGDGQISREEFLEHEPRRGGMMEEADVNGDGLVTLEEMRQRHDERRTEREKHHDARARRMEAGFATADSNGDGAVSTEEAREAAFSRMDNDGDGFISADEFRPPGQARRGHHRSHHGGSRE